MAQEKLVVAILSISDRCFAGTAVDVSGSSLMETINKGDLINGLVTNYKICPDEEICIKKIIIEWCSNAEIDLIFTTGGTGISQRDVTPEAVKAVIEKEIPGMAITLITESIRVTPFAMLSRPICGIRNKTLIITLPGSTKGCLECLSFIAPAVTHAIDLVKDCKANIERTHSAIVQTVSNDEPSEVQLPNICKRNRTSPYPMISIEQAQKIILDVASPSKSIQKNVLECLDYVVSSNVSANLNLPPFDASTMDGYAVISSDGIGILKVIGSNEAGSKICYDKCVIPKHCMRVSTGAHVPDGANSVVQIENTELVSCTVDGKEEASIKVALAVTAGQNVRKIGTDIAKGSIILPSGSKISPSDIGVMVSAGIYTTLVHPKPKIAILSTGNELQDFDDRILKEGYIYDSNRPTLKALLRNYAEEIFDIGISIDSPTELKRALVSAFSKADIVVTSGGVSMGERDILKPVLQTDFDSKIWFGRVNLKPGKPTTFASCKFKGQEKFILALPGNPVSAVVTASLFILPLCRKLGGLKSCYGTTIKAKMNYSVVLNSRPEYQRVTLDWTSNIPVAISTGIQDSSRLMSLSSASALIKLPQSTTDRVVINVGEEVDALLLNY